MAYGARLESVLGESPRGFESPILRSYLQISFAISTKGLLLPHASASRDPHQSDAPRPRLVLPRSLLWRGFFAALAFTTPVFGVLYVIALPDGPVLAVIATHIAAVLLASAGAIGYFRSAIWIGPDSSMVTERGFFGRLGSFDKSDSASILRAEVFTSDGTESRPQLVVLSADNRRLLRMRGQYWTREHMDLVTEAMDVPVHNLPETVSIGELRSDYPHTLYLLERRPLLVVLVAIGSTALAAGLLVLVLSLLKALHG